jgi:uncharacterized protein (TIGR02270 family)
MGRTVGQVLPNIVQQHFDTYRFLWSQRQGALRSPDFTEGDLARVEDRMEAHLDGLLVAGEHAITLLEANLAGDDASAVLAAAFVLLAMDRDDAAAKVVEALLQAQGSQIDGLRQALCLGDITRIVPRLRELFASPSTLAAAVAAEALAFHGRLDASSLRLAALLSDEDPAVRRVAWRVVAILDSADRRNR